MTLAFYDKIDAFCNKANLKKMFISGLLLGFFFQSKAAVTVIIFSSCLSSYSLVRNKISSSFVFVLSFFTFI